jgi:AcrR family transcriptional regulator
LLDVAEGLLAAHGPGAVTVRGVAEGAGTTTRAVYSVFGGKDGLLAGLAVRGYDLLAGLVGGLPETDDPAADLVAAGVEGFRRFAVERPQLFRLTFEQVRASTLAEPDVAPAALDSFEALLHWVRRAREAGLVDERPDVEAAFGFHSLCVGLANGELAAQPPPAGAAFWPMLGQEPRAELWRRALAAFVRGLAPGAPG